MGESLAKNAKSRFSSLFTSSVLALLLIIAGTPTKAAAQNCAPMQASLLGESYQRCFGTPNEDQVLQAVSARRVSADLLVLWVKHGLLIDPARTRVLQKLELTHPDLYAGYLTLSRTFDQLESELQSGGNLELGTARMKKRLELLSDFIAITLRRPQRAGNTPLFTSLVFLQNQVDTVARGIRPKTDSLIDFHQNWNRTKELLSQYAKLSGEAQALFLSEMTKLEYTATALSVTRDLLKGAAIATVTAGTLGTGTLAVAGLTLSPTAAGSLSAAASTVSLEILDGTVQQLQTPESHEFDSMSVIRSATAQGATALITGGLTPKIATLGGGALESLAKKGVSQLAQKAAEKATIIGSSVTVNALSAGVAAGMEAALEGEKSSSEILSTAATSALSSLTPEGLLAQAGARIVEAGTAATIRRTQKPASSVASLGRPLPTGPAKEAGKISAILTSGKRALSPRVEERLQEEEQVLFTRLRQVSFNPPQKLTPPGSAIPLKPTKPRALNTPLPDLPGLPRDLSEFRSEAHALLHDPARLSKWLIEFKREALLDSLKNQTSTTPALQTESHRLDRKTFLRAVIRRMHSHGLSISEKTPWHVLPKACCSDVEFVAFFEKTQGGLFYDLPFHGKKSPLNDRHGAETHLIQALYLAEHVKGGGTALRNYLSYLGSRKYRGSSTLRADSEKARAEDAVSDLWAPVFDQPPGRRSPAAPEWLRPEILSLVFPIQ